MNMFPSLKRLGQVSVNNIKLCCLRNIEKHGHIAGIQYKTHRFSAVRLLCTKEKFDNVKIDRITNSVKDTNMKIWLNWPVKSRGVVRTKFRLNFSKLSVLRKYKPKGFNQSNWLPSISNFEKLLVKDPGFFFNYQEDFNVWVHNVINAEKDEVNDLFFNQFMVYVKRSGLLEKLEEAEKKLLQYADLSLPHEWYPVARLMKRKVIYHVGPTNSGKTYEALERLKKAGEDGGIYCGPLRLLALEIYEKMNLTGIYCSLLTGQEKRLLPMSTHVACTIEMANINKPWDVAVIDEIQMIADPDRGFAWTRAFLALQAKEIHLCGSSEALDIIRKFCMTTGDDFQVQSYERRTPLTIADTSLQSLERVRSGDCLIAFSRRQIFETKREIERFTNLKCCVIYGNLPPETRSQQARLFNSEDSGYDVLVASDAVGMGLNLNIQRVVFTALKKFNGTTIAEIPPSMVKQIAGRAGRSGTRYAGGVATCVNPEDVQYLTDSYYEEPEALGCAGLFPGLPQLEEFAAQLPPDTPLSELLDRFVALARIDGNFFMCRHEMLTKVAERLKSFPMTLQDRFTFCMAPVNMRSPLASLVFTNYAKSHSMGKAVLLNIRLPTQVPQTEMQLQDVEVKGQIIDMYLWLSLRFPKTFVEQERAMTMKNAVLELVQEGLENTTYSRFKKRLSKSFKERNGSRRKNYWESKEDQKECISHHRIQRQHRSSKHHANAPDIHERISSLLRKSV